MAEQRPGKEPAASGVDPSMEDILASIRRILAEDQPAGAGETLPPPAAPARRPEPAPAPAPAPVRAEADEVIDLTEDMLADAPAAPPEPETVPASPLSAAKPARPDPFDDIEVPMTEPAPAASNGLLGSAAAAAAAAAFGRLASEPEPRPASPPSIGIERAGGVTLEDLVRDELRPLLADWLNRHMPDVVERVVREEVRRIAGQR